MTAELTSELFGTPAHALSAAIEAREVSCVEVVTAHLDRIESLDTVYHAMISVRPRDEVLREARERDEQLARGERLGWMHGLPHAVKDLSDVRGLPTTSGFVKTGSAPVAAEDSLFVARLREAGAVFVGKTNTPEFGLGSHTYNRLGPPTRNAVDPMFSAGGSSGGAAVAVALGMVPVADGSDFMGSLRNPPGMEPRSGAEAHDRAGSRPLRRSVLSRRGCRRPDRPRLARPGAAARHDGRRRRSCPVVAD